MLQGNGIQKKVARFISYRTGYKIKTGNETQRLKLYNDKDSPSRRRNTYYDICTQQGTPKSIKQVINRTKGKY